jgi:dGTPase
VSWLRDREAYEQEELARLAPCAVKSAESRGRLEREPEHLYRTVFQRDRDRIIHCRAFRRLEYKTQVFVHHEGDHYRNRLTHTLEGAQIARTLARALRLNEDLAEAIALAHDMGHTPFGHAGERVLAELMREEGGFDHNRQSLRVVDLLEERYPGFRGLNLTSETREGILKHGCHWPHPVAVPGWRHQRGLEAQVADIADEIAYTNHDLDDGLHSGILDPEMLADLTLWREARAWALKRVPADDEPLLRTQTIIALINALVTDVIESTSQRLALAEPSSVDAVRELPEILVGFSQPTGEAKVRLKRFLRENFYHHPRVRGATERAEVIVSDLFHAYREAPSLLPDRARDRCEQDGELRAIADHIAGMTDRYAMKVHGEVTGGRG